MTLAMWAWSGRTARASVATGRTGEQLEYVSPVEVLFSPDGARLYVLCQESAQVRVLDAKSYEPMKDIAVGRCAARILAFTERRPVVCREFLG